MSETTAFVLAGGGSLGAVQVGMLKALARSNIVPDLVIGASVGAINAAYFATAPSAEGVARLERTWLGLRSADVFPLSPVNSLLAILGKRGPKTALYLGDNVDDALAAQAAGVPFMAILQKTADGYRQRAKRFRDLGALTLLERARDLDHWLA